MCWLQDSLEKHTILDKYVLLWTQFEELWKRVPHYYEGYLQKKRSHFYVEDLRSYFFSGKIGHSIQGFSKNGDFVFLNIHEKCQVLLTLYSTVIQNSSHGD